MSRRVQSYRAMENLIAEGRLTRSASCDSKIAYSRNRAVAAKRGFASSRRKRRGRGVRIYHCRFCGNYHLTGV